MLKNLWNNTGDTIHLDLHRSDNLSMIAESITLEFWAVGGVAAEFSVAGTYLSTIIGAYGVTLFRFEFVVTITQALAKLAALNFCVLKIRKTSLNFGLDIQLPVIPYTGT